MTGLAGAFASGGRGREPVTGLTKKRQAFLNDMKQDASLFVWGTDPEEPQRTIVQTLDKATPQTPIKPMPMWPYLPFALASFWNTFKKARPQLPGMRAVDKPRQLMMSWLALMFCEWVCLSMPYSRCLLNKATQDEAAFMLEDRLVNVVHRHYPDWFREWAGPKWSATDETIEYLNGSSFAATGANVDERAARGEQATVFFVDEAARHPQLREVHAAIYPMTQMILFVSTPEAGSPGSAFYAEILGRRDSE